MSTRALPCFAPLTLLLACTGADGPVAAKGGADSAADSGAGGADSDANGDGEGEGGGPDGPVIWGEVQACPSPLPSPTYVEHGADLGFLPRQEDDGSHLAGSSLAVEDLDQDGDLDIVQTILGSPMTVYWQTSGSYLAEPVGPVAERGRLTLEDVDQDGAVDLMAGPIWWRSEPGGLGGQAAVRGFPTTLHPMDMMASDFNGDALIDYFAVVSSPTTDAEDRRDAALYADGADSFSVAPIEGPDGTGNAAQGSLVDWDGDGDLDVYLTNDMGAFYGGNRLYQADDGVFSSVSATGCLPTFAGMAHTFGDYDRDGDEDIFIGGTLDSVLLRREETGGCVDFSAPLAADPLAARDPRSNPMVWATSFLDFDNDGRLDILASEGDLYHAPGSGGITLPAYEAPIDLLQQQEDGRFLNVGAALGLAETGSHRAVLAEDLNGDGVQELLVADVDEPLRVYMSTGCTAAAWLRVEAPPHTTVTVEAGGGVWTAVTRRERGVGAAGPSAVHIGLGDVAEVDRVVLRPLQGEPLELAGPFSPRRTLRWAP
ncbi:MAG: CRTAC1 family protein [Deltaproteobacteria bacterium]|nr:CRTAC1 family protein [Deltaproteobacteria bacterium]